MCGGKTASRKAASRPMRGEYSVRPNWYSAGMVSVPKITLMMRRLVRLGPKMLTAPACSAG